jgi:hypothetical protein
VGCGDGPKSIGYLLLGVMQHEGQAALGGYLAQEIQWLIRIGSDQQQNYLFFPIFHILNQLKIGACGMRALGGPKIDHNHPPGEFS